MMPKPLLLVALLFALSVHADAQTPPPDSEMAKLTCEPFATLENPAILKPGGNHFESKESSAFESGELPPGVLVGIRYRCVSEPGGAKGDCTVAKTVDPDFKMLGGWFYISPDTVVEKIGIQIQEANGEYFFLSFPGDFTGWKWLEASREVLVPMNTKDSPFDGVLSKPIVRVSIFWFQGNGAVEVGVAGLMQAVQ